VSKARPSLARLYVLLSLMLIFWSANYIIGKIALREFPPMLLVGLRTVLSALILLPFYLWREFSRGAWSWRDWRILLPAGVCGVMLNQTFFVLGLARTSVAHAGIAIAMTPVLVLSIAAAIGQERLTARKILGVAVAFTGIVVIQVAKTSGSAATLTGDLLVLLGALTLAGFTVFGRSISSRYGALTVNTIAYTGGSLALAPFIWAGSLHFRFSSVSAVAWWSLVYMALACSVFAYLIYYHALKYIPASRVSGLSYLQPVLATIMAIPLLREPVTGGLLIGGGLTLAGVYVAERS
jgi:drug/metabolite transporter (DMT)-like permease